MNSDPVEDTAADGQIVIRARHVTVLELLEVPFIVQSGSCVETRYIGSPYRTFLPQVSRLPNLDANLTFGL